VWQKKYEEAKAKYDEDMKAFLDAGGEKKAIVKKSKREAKPAKDPEKPKKPAGGAFGCFLAENRPEFQKQTAGQPITAVAKLASTKWQALSEDEKKPYEEMYAKKKAEYEEAMKSYVPLPSAEADEKPAKKQRVSKEDKEAAKQTKASEKEAAKEQKEADKKAKADAKKATPKGKAKAKAAAKGKKATPEAPSVELAPTIAAKAEKANLKDKLLKLAAREDVMSSGKSQTAMLKALEENNGLLHAAKRALLGA
jgi:hypothetical protein